MVQGNAMLPTAKDLVDALDPKIDGALTKQWLLLFGVRIVHDVFRKPDPSCGASQYLDAIGARFAMDLATLSGQPVPSPWGAPEADGRGPWGSKFVPKGSQNGPEGSLEGPWGVQIGPTGVPKRPWGLLGWSLE